MLPEDALEDFAELEFALEEVEDATDALDELAADPAAELLTELLPALAAELELREEAEEDALEPVADALPALTLELSLSLPPQAASMPIPGTASSMTSI